MGEYQFFKKEEALAKFRQNKLNDSHWQAVRGDRGEKKVHLDFVSSLETSGAISKDRAVAELATKLQKVVDEDEAELSSVHVRRLKSKKLNNTKLSYSDKTKLERAKQRKEYLLKIKNANNNKAIQRDVVAPRIFQREKSPAGIVKTKKVKQKKTRKAPERKLQCNLCEQMFPESSLVAEQLRSSIFALRKIFQEQQQQIESTKTNEMFPNENRDTSLLPSSGSTFSTTDELLTPLEESAVETEDHGGSKVTQQENDKISETRKEEPIILGRSSSSKYKFSRMYDKVKVCLFCNQFFPFDEFRKNQKKRRNARVGDKNQVVDLEGIARATSLRRVQTRTKSFMDDFEDGIPPIRIPGEEIYHMKVRSVVEIRKEREKKEKIEKQLNALKQAIQFVEGEIFDQSNNNNNNKKQQNSKKKKRKKVEKLRQIEKVLEDTFQQNNNKPWVPNGSSPQKKMEDFRIVSKNEKQPSINSCPTKEVEVNNVRKLRRRSSFEKFFENMGESTHSFVPRPPSKLLNPNKINKNYKNDGEIYHKRRKRLIWLTKYAKAAKKDLRPEMFVPQEIAMHEQVLEEIRKVGYMRRKMLLKLENQQADT